MTEGNVRQSDLNQPGPELLKRESQLMIGERKSQKKAMANALAHR